MTAPGALDGGFAGFVLCGGASRRMGRDKAFVDVDGVAMVRRVADALAAAGASPVVAVGGDRPRLLAAGLDVIDDAWPGEGPLGGVITALDAAGPQRRALVLSCDLLAPDPAAMAGVVAELQAHDCDLAVPVVDGHAQWLHSAWHGRVAVLLADVFASGERSVAGATLGLRRCDVRAVPAAAVRDADVPGDLRR